MIQLQLGGNLDVNGRQITSASSGNIEINLTALVKCRSVVFFIPTADGNTDPSTSN